MKWTMVCSKYTLNVKVVNDARIVGNEWNVRVYKTSNNKTEFLFLFIKPSNFGSSCPAVVYFVFLGQKDCQMVVLQFNREFSSIIPGRIKWLIRPRTGKIKRILCSDWLPDLAMEPRVGPARRKFSWACNKSLIDQAHSVKVRTGYWSCSFLLLSLFPVSTERKKRTWPISSYTASSLLFFFWDGRMLETFSLAVRGSEGRRTTVRCLISSHLDLTLSQ